MIRAIEERSLNALPAFETLLVDGWIVRFAEGYTRRANSVNPLYPSTTPLMEKIEQCEALYTARGLKPTYKMTSAAQPPELDSVLENCGYDREADTSVQVLRLAGATFPEPHGVELVEHLTDAWFADQVRLNAVSPANAVRLRRILASIQPRTGFARVIVDGQTLACGLGVLEAGYIGFYDIVTAPERRRQGWGEQIMRALLAWGARNGAHTAYLQVMLNNPPALRLYQKLGFQQEYIYWYRVKSNLS
ncbi:MAG TPA: GNAT family N-acetyltransferase [Anaerolineaceae bacterium]